MYLHSLFNHFLSTNLPAEKSLPSNGFMKASLVIAAHAPAVARISDDQKALFVVVLLFYQLLLDDVHDPHSLLNTVLRFHRLKNTLHVRGLNIIPCSRTKKGGEL